MKTEDLLIQVLEEVVGTKHLTADSRFLDIGGNSLNLVEVLQQIKTTTGVSVSPRLFFDQARSSVAALASEIDRELATSHCSAPVAG